MINISGAVGPDDNGRRRVVLDLDEDGFNFLQALAAAWTARQVVTITEQVTGEMFPHVRQYAEDAARLRLQGRLAALGLAALWTQGPEWIEGPGNLHHLELRALTVPVMALTREELERVR